MAIKFRDERLKTEVVVARQTVKDVVSGDIELKCHDGSCQVSEILDVKARPRDVRASIIENGVEVTGIVLLDCLYNAEEVLEEGEGHRIKVFRQETKFEFDNFIEMPDAIPGMTPQVTVRIADVSFEVMETDVLQATVTLSEHCALSEVRDFKCITQVTGVDREEVIEQQLRIEEWIGSENIRTSVIKEVEINDHFPEVEDILAIIGDITKAEFKTEENGVTVEGVMEVNVLYRAKEQDEEKLKVVDDRVEFIHNIDVSGVEAGMVVYGGLKLVDLSVQKVSENRARIVGQVECSVKVTKPRRLTVVTDVRNEMIDAERVLLRLEEVVGRNRVKDTIVHRINVPPTRPDVKRYMQTYARVKELASMVNDGGVIVEGNLEGSAFYGAYEEFARGELAVCLKDCFDFDSYIPVEDCEEGMDVYVETDVKRTSCQVLNDRTLELNVVLEKSVRVTKPVEVECLTDLVEISPLVDAENPPSYIIYVVQRDDNLWKIARRYKVNMEELIEYNNLEEPDRLEIGQKITIPRMMLGAAK